MSRGQRIVLLALAAIVAVFAVILIRPGGERGRSERQPASAPRQATPRATGEAEPRPSPSPPKPRATTIALRAGRPVGGIKDVTVKSGDTVRLAFRGDTAEEAHIHGYDRTVQIEPGKTARVSFPARVEGVFEIESHSSGTELASLRVEP
jgi:hypothetical protein